MKKIFLYTFLVVLILAIISGFSLIGCKTKVAETTAAAEKFTVGYDIYWEGNSWSLQMAEEFKWTIESKYKDIVGQAYYTSSNGDIAKNVSNFEDLVAKKCDIIFITPLTPDNLISQIDAAMAEGIKVVVFGAGYAGKNYTAFVNAADFEKGKTSAEWLVKTLNGKGDIVMINGIAGNQAAIDSNNGALSVFDKEPGIKVLDIGYSDWDPGKTKTITQDFLQAYPDLDGIWLFNEPRSSTEVFLEMGLPFIPINWEAENGALRLWKENIDKGLVAEACSKPQYLSAIACDVGIAALTGKTFEKDTIVPNPIDTVADLDKIIKPDLSDKVWVHTTISDERLKEIFPK